MASPSRYDVHEGERDRWNSVHGNNFRDRFQNNDNVNVNVYNDNEREIDSDNEGEGDDEEPITTNLPLTTHKMKGSPVIQPSQIPQTQVHNEIVSTTSSQDRDGPPTGLPGWPGKVDKSDPKYQPSTLSTTWSVVAETKAVSAHPEQGIVYTTPATPYYTQTAVPTGPPRNGGYFSGDFDLKTAESKKVVLYAAVGVVPVVVLSILGIFFFFYLRKRKRQRETAAAQQKIDEMKTRGQPLTTAPYDLPPPPSPSSASPEYSVDPPSIHAHFLPSGTPPPMAGPTTPQPVILGPIGSDSNGAYFTGIDTSDVVSVNDRTGLGDPFADSNSLSEEPPPPYRPRSLPPISRDSSVRMPVAAHSRTNLISQERSPFADPRDDDAVSVLSGTAMHRQQDAMSVVSDLSYQEEPVVTRRAV